MRSITVGCVFCALSAVLVFFTRMPAAAGEGERRGKQVAEGSPPAAESDAKVKAYRAEEAEPGDVRRTAQHLAWPAARTKTLADMAPLAARIPPQSTNDRLMPTAVERKSKEAAKTSGVEPAVNEAVRKKVQARLGVGLSADKIKDALAKGPGSREFREVLADVRRKAKPLLVSERIAPKRRLSAGRAGGAPSVASALERTPPRKQALAPLTARAGSERVTCEREAKIGEVEKEVAEEQDPALRERKMLVLAANHVGQGNYGEAKRLYDELAATSADPAVTQAVKRNLRVVDKQIEIIGERDNGRRERLELELAEVHRDLGHAKAAKQICRRLAAQAKEADVKSEARRILATGLSPRPEQHLEFLKSKEPPGDAAAGDGKQGEVLEQKGGAQ